MGKRWRKEKAGQQQKKRRKKRYDSGGNTSSAGGTMGGLRRWTQNLARGGKGQPVSAKAKLLDRVMWVAVFVIGAVVIARRC